MARGGTRSGAGRKRGSLANHTLAAQEIRNCLVQRVLQEKGPILSALINKAKQGDVSALREILDRTLGKMTEQSGANDEKTFQSLKDIQDTNKKIFEFAREQFLKQNG